MVKGNLRKKIEKEFLYELIVFCASIVAISLLYKNNLLLTLLLIAFWGICLKLWHTKRDFFFFVSGAIIGPVAEIIAIYFGAWHYTNPTQLGIPIWLPLAWGIFTVMIVRIADTFAKFWGIKW